jgi:tape measure domain-containing protein
MYEQVGIEIVLEGLSKFNSDMNGVRKSISDLGGSARGITSPLSNMAGGLARIVEYTAGNLLASGIRAIGDAMVDLGKNAIDSAADLQRTTLMLQGLVAAEMAQGDKVTISKQIQNQATEKQIDKLQDLELSRNKQIYSMKEEELRIQQLTAKYGLNGVATQELIAQHNISIKKFNDTTAAIEDLKSKAEGYTTLQETIYQNQSTVNEMFDLAAGKTDILIAKLRTLSVTSPFTFQDIMTTYKYLMTFGVATDKAVELTQAMVDLGAARGLDSEQMQRFAYNLSQVFLAGKILAVDMRQLKLVTVDLATIVRKEMNMSIEELNAGLKSGKISMEDFQNAFIKFSKENAGGAAKRLSQTFIGLKSNIKDLFYFAAADLITPALQRVTDAANEVFQSMIKLVSEGVLKKVGEDIGTVVDVLFNLAYTYGPDVIKFFNNLGGAITFGLTPPDLSWIGRIIKFYQDRKAIVPMTPMEGYGGYGENATSTTPTIGGYTGYGTEAGKIPLPMKPFNITDFLPPSITIAIKTIGNVIESLHPIVKKLHDDFISVRDAILNEIKKAIDWLTGAEALGKLDNIVKFVTLHWDEFRTAILGFLGVQVIYSVILGLVGLLTALTSPVILLGILVGGLAAAWIGNWGDIQTVITNAYKDIKPKLDDIYKFIVNSLTPSINDIAKGWGEFSIKVNESLPGLGKLVEFLEKIALLVGGVALLLSKYMLDFIAKFDLPMATAIVDFLNNLGFALDALSKGDWTSFFSNLGNGLANFGSSINKMIANMMGRTPITWPTNNISPLPPVKQQTQFAPQNPFSGISAGQGIGTLDWSVQASKDIANLTAVINTGLANIGLSISTWFTSSVSNINMWLTTLQVNIITWLGVQSTTLTTWLSATWISISTWFTTAVANIGLYMSQIWLTISTYWGNIFTSVVNILILIGTTINTKFMEFVTSIGTWMVAGVKAVNDTYNDWLKAGENIIMGLVEGVKNKMQDFIDSVVEAVKKAVEAAKKAAGVESPSKVFMGIGENMAKGLALGIQNLKDLPALRVQAMTTGAVNAANVNAQPVYRSSTINMGGITINNARDAALAQAWIQQTVANSI